MKCVFFGGSQFSVYVLEELKLHGILPKLIITTPDKPKGRKLILTPTPAKVWAKENSIEVLNNYNLLSKDYDLFLVASYGKLIPKEIFEIPTHKTLNIHPSLLPKYRGASPIVSQILSGDTEIGITIMEIVEEMDAGPVVIQKQLKLEEWPIGNKELEKILAIEGARLFAHILPEWLEGAIDPIMQDETKATFCQKIKKEDGLLDIDLNNLEKNADQNLLKIKAFEGWPTAYFFLDGKRIIITDATLENSELKILTVKPEGKSEMPFEDFLRGLRSGSPS